MRKMHILAMIVTHTAAFAAGGIVIVPVLKKRFEEQYDNLMKNEIKEAKKFYMDLGKKEYETPEEAVKALHGQQVHDDAVAALKTYQGQVEESARDIPKNSPPHVLASRDDRGPAYENARQLLKRDVPEADDETIDELAGMTTEELISKAGEIHDDETRKIEEWNKKQEQDRNIFTADAPPPPAAIQFNEAGDPISQYIISESDWLDNDGEQEQIILMYYTGDQTLVDEHETIMDDGEIELSIGSRELIQFGNKSNDRNTVYIRNPKTNTDYYVLRSDGAYGEEVAGFRGADE